MDVLNDTIGLLVEPFEMRNIQSLMSLDQLGWSRGEKSGCVSRQVFTSPKDS